MHDQKVKMSIYPALLVKSGAGAGTKAADAYVDTNGYKAAVFYVVASGMATPDSLTFHFWGSNAANGSSPTELTTANGLLSTDWVVDGATTLSAPGTYATSSTVSQVLSYAVSGSAAVVMRLGYVGPFRYLGVTADTGTSTLGFIGCAFVELLEPDVKPVHQD